MTHQILQDGILITLDDSTFAAEFPAAPQPAPQTIFPSETLMTTLFTLAEKLGFAAKPQGVLFMSLIAAAGQIDITSATFKADIAQAVQDGFLTQPRADQVLAGSPAPQGS